MPSSTTKWNLWLSGPRLQIDRATNDRGDLEDLRVVRTEDWDRNLQN